MDLAVPRGEFYGILEDVPDHLLETRRVGVDEPRLFGEVEREVDLLPE